MASQSNGEQPGPDYSPINSHLLLRSLQATETPEREGMITPTETRFRLGQDPPEYFQRFQQLALPPCSPQAPLMIEDRLAVRGLELIPFPSEIQSLGRGIVSEVPPLRVELRPEILANHPTFQQVSEFTHESLVPVNARIGQLIEFVHGCTDSIRKMLEICTTNERGVLKKLDYL